MCHRGVGHAAAIGCHPDAARLVLDEGTDVAQAPIVVQIGGPLPVARQAAEAAKRQPEPAGPVAVVEQQAVDLVTGQLAYGGPVHHLPVLADQLRDPFQRTGP